MPLYGLRMPHKRRSRGSLGKLVRLAPNTLYGLHAAEWVNDGTNSGTYAGLTRSSYVFWHSLHPTTANGSGYYWHPWDEPAKPVYPSKIQVPEGL